MALQTVILTSPIGTATNWTVPAKANVLNVFLVGGGGGGGTNGGGGGGGGRIRIASGIVATPGSTISYTIGAGGNGGASPTTGGTTTFGSVSVTGGAIGGSNDGAGGASSSNLNGTTTNYSGGVGGSSNGGGGGASPASPGFDNNAGRAGGPGFLFNNSFYGGGGGGGSATFTPATSRPILGGPGGSGGGGTGGGEGNGSAGGNNTGGGGGGGGHSGTNNALVGGSANSWISTPYPVPAGTGGAGGSGIIIITYDEAEYTLSLGGSGVSENSGSMIVTLRTRNVANGAVIPYTLSGTNITSADFSPASLTGSFTVVSTDGGLTGVATATVTISPDSTTEGSEMVIFSLNNGFATTYFYIGDFSVGSLTGVESKLIQVADYNNIRTKVISVLGTGSADYGYGQTVRSTEATESTRVTVTGWANLKYDIINAWTHQYGSAPSMIDVVEGNLVKANTLTSPYNRYMSYADVLTVNRFGVHSSQVSTVNKFSVESVWPGIYGLSWNTKVYATVTATFTTADKARGFFNAGGEIRFSSSRTGGTTSTQNTTWSTLLTGIGTVSFGGNKPGQSTDPNDGLNFYRLSNSYGVWYTATATSPYSTNTFRISARTPSVVDNSTGTATTIDFLVEWIDNHSGAGGSVDLVDGTLNLAMSTLEPTGILQPTGTGSFVVESPSITSTAITP